MNRNAKPFISIVVWYFLLVYFNLIGLKLFNDSNYLYNIFTYISISACLILINKINIKSEIKKFKENYKIFLKKGFFYWGISFLLMLVSNYIITIKENLPLNELLIRENFNNNFIGLFALTVIFAPILEEVLFRYSFSKIKNKYIYIILSSVLFAFVHLSNMNEIIYLIPYGFLGMGFGLTYLKNQNIISSILIHSFHNYFVILLLVIL